MRKETIERDLQESAKLEALQEAVRAGFDDISAGRFVELEHDSIEAFLSTLDNRVSPLPLAGEGEERG